MLPFFNSLLSRLATDAAKAGWQKLHGTELQRAVDEWSEGLPEDVRVHPPSLDLTRRFDEAAPSSSLLELAETLKRKQIPAISSWYAALRERCDQVNQDAGPDAHPFFMLEISQRDSYLARLADRLHTICAQDPSLFGPTMMSAISEMQIRGERQERALAGVPKAVVEEIAAKFSTEFERFRELILSRNDQPQQKSPEWRPLVTVQLPSGNGIVETSMQFVARALVKSSAGSLYRRFVCLIKPSFIYLHGQEAGKVGSGPHPMMDIVTADAAFAGHIERDRGLYLRVPEFVNWPEEQRVSAQLVGWRIEYVLPVERVLTPCEIVFDGQRSHIAVRPLPAEDMQLIHCHKDMMTDELFMAFYKLDRSNRGLMEVQVDSFHGGFAKFLLDLVRTKSLSLSGVRVNAHRPQEWDYLLT